MRVSAACDSDCVGSGSMSGGLVSCGVRGERVEGKSVHGRDSYISSRMDIVAVMRFSAGYLESLYS